MANSIKFHKVVAYFTNIKFAGIKNKQEFKLDWKLK
jgi:hypothetical protein